MNKLLLIFVFGLCTLSAEAQKIVFTDTRPTNNSDSLELWLQNHPEANLQRLKNLLILERTYFWVNRYKMGVHFNEIQRLIKSLKQPSAQAIYHYLYVNQLIEKNIYANIEFHIRQGMGLCKKYDNKGVIYFYSLLCRMEMANYGGVSDNRKMMAYYYNLMNENVKKDTDIYNYVEERYVYLRFLMYSTCPDSEKEREVRKYLNEIGNNKNFKYAQIRIKVLLGICLYRQNKFDKSYAINKEIYNSLKPQQIRERIQMGYNVINDCNNLKRYEECIPLAKNGIYLLKKYDSLDYNSINFYYDVLRHAVANTATAHEINALVDSQLVYLGKHSYRDRSKSVIEFENRFNAELKQQKIDELKSRNDLIFTFLFLAVLVLIIFIFLGYALFKTNKQLKALNKARMNFIKIVSHDLRNPIQTFVGMGDLINHYLKKKDAESIQKVSQAIDQTSINLLKLVDNLMYSVITPKGSLFTRFTDTPLLPRINVVLSMYNSLSISKNIQFIVECPESLLAWIDSNAFDVVLRNIIDNAVKNVSQNGLIRIQAIEEKEYIAFSISDNGKGISPQKLSSIREVLREPYTLMPYQNGIGMGMVIIAKFAQSNHIKIVVESTENIGTTVQLILPISPIS